MTELTNNLEDISISDLRTLLIASDWKFTDWFQDEKILRAIVQAISVKFNDVKAIPDISLCSKENNYIRAMLRSLTELDIGRDL